MTEPAPGEPGAAPPAPHDPTLRVDRPPVPGRAARAEMEAGSRPTPPVRPDEPTVTIPGSRPGKPQPTLEFRTPVPVKVTVGPRVVPRRRYRTWPWIAAVVLALIVLGVTLLIMMLGGETIDGDADVIGSGAHNSSLSAPPAA
jgi:hypothetical protein